MAKKLTPKSLGSGMAQRVASGLKSRKSRLDAAIEAAEGKSSKKSKSKK